jgi:hypothetical protein
MVPEKFLVSATMFDVTIESYAVACRIMHGSALL